MDKTLLVITTGNYLVGFSLDYYLTKIPAETLVLFLFPFFWFGFIVIILKTVSMIRLETGEFYKSKTSQRLNINFILFLLNILSFFIMLFT